MCGCVLTVVSTALTNIAFNAFLALIFISTLSTNKIFQQEVGFNHVYCWKFANIRGIPK